ncbi:methyltransferase [Enteractinococcus coprophilus]|uniref:Ubiquinone/menaquinone biosynthesis C-methylase UbiE n=1 Tax=Enteractinococcus coprophilus TaxID=1027633 RepID=A0A543APB2_9MICC|nr:methyltransferase [Enteractinococcus coprophilus]TQL74417.1 ubiquinone/menaquinone biosynthesis C-methylase UbiE [Enteractinococcus coprophilus]
MLLAEAFTTSARRYDLLTKLNPGYRRELRSATRKLAELLDVPPGRRPVIWDLGCGTGLSTQALLKTLPNARIVGVDASAGMLAAARAKPWPDGTAFVLDRVEQLPENPAPELATAPDGVFAAYLLRNVPEAERTVALESIRALMKPGTPLVLQDYSVVESQWAQTKWTLVCFGIIIPLAAATGAQASLFTYLWRSVMRNDATRTVLTRLARAGFERATVTSARGWHRKVLHTYVALNQGRSQ